mmetsp:Transcript_95774/g.310323  ORF Transcript_95774/g.310323 Transcript_95774/m.310323 type:complete len:212 (+) Transcript_95774:267-902(+)
MAAEGRPSPPVRRGPRHLRRCLRAGAPRSPSLRPRRRRHRPRRGRDHARRGRGHAGRGRRCHGTRPMWRRSPWSGTPGGPRCSRTRRGNRRSHHYQNDPDSRPCGPRPRSHDDRRLVCRRSCPRDAAKSRRLLRRLGGPCTRATAAAGSSGPPPLGHATRSFRRRQRRLCRGRERCCRHRRRRRWQWQCRRGRRGHGCRRPWASWRPPCPT